MTGLTLNPRWNPGDASAGTADDDLRIQGLMHDLGHQMLTLSLLTETLGEDAEVTGDARQRMRLVLQEMFRAMDLMTDALPATRRPAADLACTVDLRALAAEVAQFASLAYGTSVRVQPGRTVRLEAGPQSLWRVLTNLVDNAVRAAGPDGAVLITVAEGLDAVIEIADNGPGFGYGPHGTTGLGMSVVQQLLDDAGGWLEISGRPGGGTLARVVFPLGRDDEIRSARQGCDADFIAKTA